MLKYVNTGIVFQEIPDEVTLAINISNCPCHCPGCHSHYLWEDIGMPLNTDAIDDFVSQYGTDITCIAFMGGDCDPKGVNQLAQYIHEFHPQFHVAWYSGRLRVPAVVNKADFVYQALGFIEVADNQPAPLPPEGRRHLRGHHLSLLAATGHRHLSCKVHTKKKEGRPSFSFWSFLSFIT